MTKRNRAVYSDEFKNDAVNLVTEHHLGVNVSDINRWVRESRREEDHIEGKGPTRGELEAEIRRRKKENKRLEMEREILKKAAAFFAKESD